MTSNIPSQNNILQIIKSTVDFLADITEIITNSTVLVTKISTQTVQTLNENLNIMYGPGGVIEKLEDIQTSLFKSRLNRFNPAGNRFIKMHIREIGNIVDIIKKISKKISKRKLAKIKNFEELVNYVNSIVTMMEKINISAALPIKLELLNESLSKFSDDILGTLMDMSLNVLKDYDKVLDMTASMFLLDKFLLPTIYSIISRVDSIKYIQYFICYDKLDLLSELLEKLKTTTESMVEFGEYIKNNATFKDGLILSFTAICFNIFMTIIDSLKKINLIPTEIIKLNVLNLYVLPMIFGIFNQVMDFFSPNTEVKVIIPIDGKKTVIKRKAAWKPLQYINTIIGLSMMAIIFKTFEFIQDTLKIFKIIVGSALNAWDKLQDCIAKLLDIFTYVMNYFSPLQETEINIPIFNIKKTVIRRKAEWKPLQYINTITGMINMAIVFKLINITMKAATVAALLSVPFSICAVPFEFAIITLFDIIAIVIENVNAIEKVAIKKLLILTLLIAAISFVGIELFALALVAKIVISNIGWIFLLFGAIIGVLFAVIPICMAGMVFSIVGPLAITGLFILVAVISAVVLIAYELKLLGYIELDRYAIINNVDTVLSVSRYIINMLFGGDKEDSFDNVSESTSWLGLIISVFKGSTDLIKIIAASAILVFTLISVTMILFIVVLLKTIETVAGTLNKPSILAAVNKVTSISNFIINAVFGNVEYDAETDSVNKTEQYNKNGFFKRVFGGIGDLITTVASSMMLISTALSVGAMSLIVKMLDNIKNADLNDELIKTNVAKIINVCKLVIDTVNAPSETKEANDSDGVIGKALSALLPSNLKYALDAIITMPFLAITWLSISLIDNLIDALKKIETLPDFSNIEVNVKTIMTTCKTVIDAVNSNSESIQLNKIKENQKLLKNIKKLIKNIISITKLKVSSENTSAFNAIKSIISSYVTVLLPELEKLKNIKHSDRIVMTLKDIDRISTNLTGLSKLSVKDAITGVDSVVSIVDALIEKTDNNKNISRKRRYKDSLENIDRYFTLLKRVINVFTVNNSDFGMLNVGDHEKFINNNIKFLDKVNEIDTNKLKKTTNLYEQLRKFSESINGNFNLLAEALANKLIPVLEDLKEIMTVIPEKIDSSSNKISKSVNLLNYPTTTANVTEQTRLENPNLSEEDINQIVNARMNELAKADANGISAKIDDLMTLLRGFGGENVVVKTI